MTKQTTIDGPSRSPAHWREVYDLIKTMRASELAPVDTMGCHRAGDGAESEATMRYHILTSLMLSAQTKDQVTHAAVMALRSHGLTVDNILKTDEATIDRLICKVGFHQRKAHYIKETAKVLRAKYNDDIPATLEGLVELPGVGPKMAHLTMQAAWNQYACPLSIHSASVGIGVDVHVHRISNRLGWVSTKTPEQTRESLEKWLPRDLWAEINPLLVGFGQTVCKPVGPQCGRCLANRLCPSAERTVKIKAKRLKSEQDESGNIQLKQEQLEVEVKREFPQIKEEPLALDDPGLPVVSRKSKRTKIEVKSEYF